MPRGSGTVLCRLHDPVGSPCGLAQYVWFSVPAPTILPTAVHSCLRDMRKATASSAFFAHPFWGCREPAFHVFMSRNCPASSTLSRAAGGRVVPAANRVAATAVNQL